MADVIGSVCNIIVYVCFCIALFQREKLRKKCEALEFELAKECAKNEILKEKCK